MEKSAKIIMLPTKVTLKGGEVFKMKNSLFVTITGAESRRARNSGFVPNHLYITVSQDVEPIKEGDWCLLFDRLNKLMSEPQQWLGNGVLNGGLEKIIATTDPKLGVKCHDCNGEGVRNLMLHEVYGEEKDSCTRCDKSGIEEKLPQLSQSFIEKYCNNPNKQWEVEYEEMGAWINRGQDFECVSIRPKLNPDNTITISSVEKMYSREDIWKTRIFFKCNDIEIGGYSDKYLKEKFNDWIKENL